MIAALLASVYALALWSIAHAAARRRALALGKLPGWLVPAAAVAAASITSQAPWPVASGLLTAAIGTAVAGIVDARTGRIFDPLSLAIALSGLTCAFCTNDAVDALEAAAAAGALLWVLHAVTGGRGLGLGDVKAGAALACGLGCWQHAAVAIGAAFVAGAVYGCALIATRRATRRDRVPFGPWLAAGTSLSVLIAVAVP